MARKDYKFKKKEMDVVISIGETDEKNFTVEAKDFPGGVSNAGNFILVEGIADIKFTKRQNPTAADQQVSFAEDVEFEISFPKDAAKKIKKQKDLHPNDPKLKDKTEKDLVLAYYHGGAWHTFSDQTGINGGKINGAGKKLKFKNWYADPPVGWGF